MLGIPFKAIFSNSVLQHELLIEAKLHHGQQKALRAPANRSRLVGLEFLVLHGVGRSAWNRAIAAPVNLDVYADERAYQAEAWRVAMAKMQDFYQQAANRKGIVL